MARKNKSTPYHVNRSQLGMSSLMIVGGMLKKNPTVNLNTEKTIFGPSQDFRRFPTVIATQIIYHGRQGLSLVIF